MGFPCKRAVTLFYVLRSVGHLQHSLQNPIGDCTAQTTKVALWQRLSSVEMDHVRQLPQTWWEKGEGLRGWWGWGSGGVVKESEGSRWGMVGGYTTEHKAKELVITDQQQNAT